MGRVACIIAIVVTVANATAQLRINEVQPTPPSGEPEWVEVVNAGQAAVRMASWYLCDARSCVNLPVCTVEPGEYIVLTRDAEALRETRVVQATVIECSLPSLNNTTDAVILRDADSNAVDSVFYRVDRKGRSIERGDDGWGSTYSRDSATCGYLNSRVRLWHDLRAAEITSGGPVPHINIVIRQAGTTTSRQRGVIVLADTLRMQATVPPLPPETEWTWSIPLEALPVASVIPCTVMLTRSDDRAANDTMTAVISVPPPTSSVSITEVMLAPMSHQCDYVEVYNGAPDTLDLDGWMLVDASDDTVRAAGTARIPPQHYGIIATDTIVRQMMHEVDRDRLALIRRSFSIDAGGEDITLLNPSGFTVDLARCDPVMHVADLADTRGVALEKIDPSLVGADKASWTSSGDLSGGTPGRTNSVGITLPGISRGHLDVGSSWPYAIRFRHPFRHAAAFMQIATLDGASVRTLLDNVVIGSEGAITWDGADNVGRLVPRGPYVVTFTAVDATSERVVEAVATIVASGEGR